MSTQITISPEIKLVVNTTPITGGSAGQILFQTTGNTVGESANLFWDNATNQLQLVGTGLFSSGTNLNVRVSGGGLEFSRSVDGAYNTYIFKNGSTNAVGLTFAALNGGSFIFQGTSEIMRTTSTNNVLINTTTDAGYKLDVNGNARMNSIHGGGTSTLLLQSHVGAGAAITVQFGSNQNATSGDRPIISAIGLFNPTSGASTFAGLSFTPTINQTGGANGITRGLYINPTLTAAADFRAIETTVGNVLFGTTSGNVGIGLANPVGKTDIVTGFADVSSLNQPETFRLRSTTVNGNTRVMNFGISHTGAGGANQGYGYIQFGYSGGSVDNPLVLQPLGGGVSIGAAVATSDYKLQVLQESSIKASANSGGGALGGRLSFPFAGSYSGKVAYIAQVQDTTNWFNSAGLVFATLSGSDISALTGVERMRIGGNGNVLIGTTTDAGFKLDVNGTVRTGPLKVGGQLDTAATGAGHVFARLNDNGTLIRIFNWSYGNSSGNTWVNGSEVASALFALNSTTTGFLPPRMTNAQMVAITTPAEGLVVYDLTNKKLCCYDGATWQNLF
jgi:hypothetical protein